MIIDIVKLFFSGAFGIAGYVYVFISLFTWAVLGVEVFKKLAPMNVYARLALVVVLPIVSAVISIGFYSNLILAMV